MINADEIRIILPSKDNGALEWMLEGITRALAARDPDSINHGVLGGEFGYGGYVDNSVFSMRPFYWGDCDCGWEQMEIEWCNKHKHAADCYSTVSYRLIEESPLQKEREDALESRDKLPWSSKKHDEAQKKVEEVCNRLDAFEKKVRKELCEQHGIPWNNGLGCAVHCSCSHDKDWKEWYQKSKLGSDGGHADTCALILPNFHHKATGFTVRWYKYIGRDMEIEGEGDLQTIFNDCLRSLQQ